MSAKKDSSSSKITSIGAEVAEIERKLSEAKIRLKAEIAAENERKKKHWVAELTRVALPYMDSLSIDDIADLLKNKAALKPQAE